MDDATSPAAGVHEICDASVADHARLQPAVATEFGISGHDDDLPDCSPDGHRARAELARRALAALSSARAADESERIAETVFAERIGLEVELHEAGLPMAALNSIACPVQEVRQAFDLMATDGADDWAAIARSLARVGPALAGYRVSLAESAERGVLPAARQLRRAIEQCRTWGGAGGTSAETSPNLATPVLSQDRQNRCFSCA